MIRIREDTRQVDNEGADDQRRKVVAWNLREQDSALWHNTAEFC